jgi:hypothetical protein
MAQKGVDPQMQNFLEVRQPTHHTQRVAILIRFLARPRSCEVSISIPSERSPSLLASHSRTPTHETQEEKRKAMFNEVVSNLANVCFDKCVTTPGR